MEKIDLHERTDEEQEAYEYYRGEGYSDQIIEEFIKQDMERNNEK